MTFIAKFENVSVCLSGDAVDWSFVLLADPWDGMDIMLPPRRIVDLFCCCLSQVPSSQNAIVSDMEMKPISPYLTCIPVFLVERHGLFRRGDLRIAGSSLSLPYTLFYHHHSLVTAWTGRDRGPRRVGAEADKPMCPDYCS